MSGTTFPSYPGQQDQQYQPGGSMPSGDRFPSQPSQPPQPSQHEYRNDNGGGGNNGGYQSRDNQRPAYQGGGGGWQRNGGGNNGGGWQRGGNNGGGGGWQRNGGGNNGGAGAWNKKADDGDLTLYKPYAVTGNQDFTPEIKTKLENLVKKLEGLGYTARTGGMDGIEKVVIDATKKIELHLPWRGFNDMESKFTYNSDRAFAVAKQFHPTFDTMSKGVQAFLAKNARLIMGDKMNSPALFLLCWTEDGVESVRNKTARTGFTGHPIAIASAIGIPVFNLGKPDTEQRLNFYLESLVHVENQPHPSNQ